MKIIQIRKTLGITVVIFVKALTPNDIEERINRYNRLLSQNLIDKNIERTKKKIAVLSISMELLHCKENGVR